MNNLLKVFSDFKAFYNEINAATLTGAIDVIVVEQSDGTYLCSPFHVRFGKLGVLRSREKIVDIQVNGEPVSIHMKLGESGEAFFVEECPEDDLEILPEHMATSPIPTNEFHQYEDSTNSNASDTITVATTNAQDGTLQIPRPRRNSIDLTSQDPVEDKESKKFENQVSDYTTRRHTDLGTQRRDLTAAKKEYTTQMLRQEWEAEKEQLQLEEEEIKAAVAENELVFRPISVEEKTPPAEAAVPPTAAPEDKSQQQDSKNGKKKRRKKSVLKKKNQGQRKNSTSSGSTQSEMNELEAESTAKEASSSTDNSLPTENATDLPCPEPETPNRTRELDHHFFSDTEAQAGPSPHRPSTPIQSDTEFEVSVREKSGDLQLMTNSASWKWGELPTSLDESPKDTHQAKRSMLSGIVNFMKKDRQKQRNKIDGLYLDDLVNEDDEVAALYFPPHQHKTTKTEDDRESGNGTSVPQSPTSMEGIKSLDSDYDENKEKALDFVAISLCGPLEKGYPSEEEFRKNQIQFADICSNPTVFSSPNLVVRLNGKYYSWQVACPIVMTLIIYQKPLPSDVCEQLDKLTKEQQQKMLQSGDESPKEGGEQQPRSSWWSWRRSGSQQSQQSKPPHTLEVNAAAVATQTSRANSPGDGSLHQISDKSMTHQESLEISLENEFLPNQKPGEKYRKTLRLSSDQIDSLNLKTGMNEVEFSVTTAYQGTSRCKCYLFKWRHNDKVVISDIDGTITRSDVLGHILPIVGKDWSQIGVAQLFSKIEQNGYKLLYLSARAIGQSRATREYLRSIRQGNVKLPDGPLLLNPTSLISAFHREVIERKPEAFKIACLSDIKALFPEGNPFYAGYGNRINDVWAYRAVGIPIMRIFTINTKGELKHEMTQTFQSTYASMAYIVDQVFPPPDFNDEEDIEYSSFNYWRDPVLDIPDIDLNLSGSGSGRSTPNTLSSTQILNKALPTIPENIKI